ncbi:MAG: radical SAM family heme chaperone HemW [Acidobacteriota bacterium]
MSSRPRSEAGGGAREPAGLYLHIPFCSAVCPYCDFAVLVGGRERRQAFVEDLLTEIALYGEERRGEQRHGQKRHGEERRDKASFAGMFRAGVDSIYFGGGTPSMLEPEDLARILAALRDAFPIVPGATLSFEANPEDVTAEGAKAWRELGVSMLSLGVQSFDEGELRFLGRRHTTDEARRCVTRAMAAGFVTVSVDLIFSLPIQTPEVLRRNLEQAIDLAPDHLSGYELELHPRTAFGKRQARGELEALPDTQQAEHFRLIHSMLSDAGYAAYEVSNFARGAEHRSHHNQKYWRHVPYLGLGPSAHSFDGHKRWWNERHLAAWQRRLRAGEKPTAGQETLSQQDLALETLMLGLRTTAGVDLGRFARRFAFDLVDANRGLIERLEDDGLLSRRGDHLVPTLAGLAVADGLAAAFSLTAG